MIAEQEAESPIGADGETRSSSKIIFRDDVVLHFIVIPNIDRRDPVDGGFDLVSTSSTQRLAIAIVDETRGRVSRYRDQLILGVVGQGVVFELCPLEDVTRGHVAVRVIAVGVAVREGGRRVFVRGGIGVGRAVLAGEVARGRVVGVAFGVQSVRSAGDVGTEQAIQFIVGEGLSLEVGGNDGIGDGLDVANRIVVVGSVLQNGGIRGPRGGHVVQASARLTLTG